MLEQCPGEGFGDFIRLPISASFHTLIMEVGQFPCTRGSWKPQTLKNPSDREIQHLVYTI